MTAPPEVKSAVDLAWRTLNEDISMLSHRKLLKLCLALARAVDTVWKWSVGE